MLWRYQSENLPEFSEIDLRDVNQIGNFESRPIHVASTRGNVNEVTALLKDGAEVEVIGELGSTPLHDAVGQSHSAMVNILL